MGVDAGDKSSAIGRLMVASKDGFRYVVVVVVVTDVIVVVVVTFFLFNYVSIFFDASFPTVASRKGFATTEEPPPLPF